MFAEGESELRDLVVQNLESCGFINKIKAELRAGVFLALSEEGSLKKKVPLFNKKLEDFMSTSNGKLALSVVREFLEFFNLNFTLSVFDPEVSSSCAYANRITLCEDLNLNESEFEGPILAALLKKLPEKKLSGDDVSEEKISGYLADKNVDKIESVLNSLKSKTEHGKEFFEEKNETVTFEAEKRNKSNHASSITSIDFFSKPEEKDIFKDQSIDNFFDDPVPSEKPSFLHISNESIEQKKLSPILTHEKESAKVLNDLKKPSIYSQPDKATTSSGFKDQKNSSSFLSSEKGSLSSLRDLPALTKQDNSRNKECLSDILDGKVDNFQEDLAKKDADPESNEEYSDKQMISEESIEEEIEEEFSAGLDDLLNSSLSLGEDATSDQTISQTSVVEGVDHVESCNTVN